MEFGTSPACGVDDVRVCHAIRWIELERHALLTFPSHLISMWLGRLGHVGRRVGTKRSGDDVMLLYSRWTDMAVVTVGPLEALERPR